MSTLEVEDITKYYRDILAVDEVSFSIEEGEFATLLGPSGCGKSTTLHIIAGLLEPSEGQVFLRGSDVTETRPEERNIGLVFQHSTLFPHMTVEENLRYGLRMQDVDPAVHDERVDKYLDLVQLPEQRDANPSELSGGQQRRISLARSLIYEPDILLLDEPLTGLDRVLREDMRAEIKQIVQNVGVTTLYVTHDQAEALSMSDRVLVMNEGRIEQIADPTTLYEQPTSTFVADFVGKSASFDGRVAANSPVVDDGEHPIAIPEDAPVSAEEPVSVYVRPEDIGVRVDGESDGAGNAFPGEVIAIQYLGHRNEIEVRLADGSEVTAYTETRNDLSTGESVTVTFAPEDTIVL